MKDETTSVAIGKFLRLKPNMFIHVHAVVTISHNECKDVLLNKKCLRNSINRIQSKDHKIGT